MPKPAESKKGTSNKSIPSLQVPNDANSRSTWTCPHCTVNNTGARKLCHMCGTRRGADIAPGLLREQQRALNAAASRSQNSSTCDAKPSGGQKVNISLNNISASQRGARLSPPPSTPPAADTKGATGHKRSRTADMGGNTPPVRPIHDTSMNTSVAPTMPYSSRTPTPNMRGAPQTPPLHPSYRPTGQRPLPSTRSQTPPLSPLSLSRAKMHRQSLGNSNPNTTSEPSLVTPAQTVSSKRVECHENRSQEASQRETHSSDHSNAEEDETMDTSSQPAARESTRALPTELEKGRMLSIFQTGDGRQVTINREQFIAASRRFIDGTLDSGLGQSQPSADDEPVISESMPSDLLSSLPGHGEVDHKKPAALPSNGDVPSQQPADDNATASGGISSLFSTAAGKAVTISAKALSMAKSKFIGLFEDAADLKEAADAKSPQRGAKEKVASIAEEEENMQFTLFTTADGTPVRVSQESLERGAALIEAGPTLFETAAGKPIKLTPEALRRGKMMLKKLGIDEDSNNTSPESDEEATKKEQSLEARATGNKVNSLTNLHPIIKARQEASSLFRPPIPLNSKGVPSKRSSIMFRGLATEGRSFIAPRQLGSAAAPASGSHSARSVAYPPVGQPEGLDEAKAQHSLKVRPPPPPPMQSVTANSSSRKTLLVSPTSSKSPALGSSGTEADNPGVIAGKKSAHLRPLVLSKELAGLLTVPLQHPILPHHGEFSKSMDRHSFSIASYCQPLPTLQECKQFELPIQTLEELAKSAASSEMVVVDSDGTLYDAEQLTKKLHGLFCISATDASSPLTLDGTNGFLTADHYRKALTGGLGADPAGCTLPWVENALGIATWLFMARRYNFSSVLLALAKPGDTECVSNEANELPLCAQLHAITLLASLVVRYNYEHCGGKRSVLRQFYEHDLPLSTRFVAYVVDRLAPPDAPSTPQSLLLPLAKTVKQRNNVSPVRSPSNRRAGATPPQGRCRSVSASHQHQASLLSAAQLPFVSASNNLPHVPPGGSRVSLTDGCYLVHATLDMPLLQAVRERQLGPGSKLEVWGAIQATGSGCISNACHPLEADGEAVLMHLGYNGTHILVPSFQKPEQTPRSEVDDLLYEIEEELRQLTEAFSHNANECNPSPQATEVTYRTPLGMAPVSPEFFFTNSVRRIHPAGGLVPSIVGTVTRVLPPHFIERWADGSSSSSAGRASSRLSGASNAKLSSFASSERNGQKTVRNLLAETRYCDALDRARHTEMEQLLSIQSVSGDSQDQRDKDAGLSASQRAAMSKICERFKRTVNIVHTIVVEDDAGDVAAIQQWVTVSTGDPNDNSSSHQRALDASASITAAQNAAELLPKEGSRIRLFNLYPSRSTRQPPPFHGVRMLFARPVYNYLPLPAIDLSSFEQQLFAFARRPTSALEKFEGALANQMVDICAIAIDTCTVKLDLSSHNYSRSSPMKLGDQQPVLLSYQRESLAHNNNELVCFVFCGCNPNVFGCLEIRCNSSLVISLKTPPKGSVCQVQNALFIGFDTVSGSNAVARFIATEYTSITTSIPHCPSGNTGRVAPVEQAAKLLSELEALKTTTLSSTITLGEDILAQSEAENKAALERYTDAYADYQGKLKAYNDSLSSSSEVRLSQPLPPPPFSPVVSFLHRPIVKGHASPYNGGGLPPDSSVLLPPEDSASNGSHRPLLTDTHDFMSSCEQGPKAATRPTLPGVSAALERQYGASRQNAPLAWSNDHRLNLYQSESQFDDHLIDPEPVHFLPASPLANKAMAKQDQDEASPAIVLAAPVVTGPPARRTLLSSKGAQVSNSTTSSSNSKRLSDSVTASPAKLSSTLLHRDSSLQQPVVSPTRPTQNGFSSQIAPDASKSNDEWTNGAKGKVVTPGFLSQQRNLSHSPSHEADKDSAAGKACIMLFPNESSIIGNNHHNSLVTEDDISLSSPVPSQSLQSQCVASLWPEGNRHIFGNIICNSLVFHIRCGSCVSVFTRLLGPIQESAFMMTLARPENPHISVCAEECTPAAVQQFSQLEREYVKQHGANLALLGTVSTGLHEYPFMATEGTAAHLLYSLLGAPASIISSVAESLWWQLAIRRGEVLRTLTNDQDRWSALLLRSCVVDETTLELCLLGDHVAGMELAAESGDGSLAEPGHSGKLGGRMIDFDALATMPRWNSAIIPDGSKVLWWHANEWADMQRHLREHIENLLIKATIDLPTGAPALNGSLNLSTTSRTDSISYDRFDLTYLRVVAENCPISNLIQGSWSSAVFED